MKYIMIFTFFVGSIVIADNNEELIKAINNRDIKKSMRLINSNTKINKLDKSGNSLVALAASMGLKPIVGKLLSRRANPNLSSGNGESALLRAVSTRYENIGIIKLLLDKGGNINGRSGALKLTPLHRAVINKKDKIMNLLLDEGANINMGDNKGETALHSAAYYGNKEAVIELIKRGANVDAHLIGKPHITPLYMAIEQYKHIDQLSSFPDDMPKFFPDISKDDLIAIIEILLENGAKTDVIKLSGFLPIEIRAIIKRYSTEKIRHHKPKPTTEIKEESAISNINKEKSALD